MKFLLVKGRKYEVVNEVPKGYLIWNIGHNMLEGYIPLCEWLNDDKDDFDINLKTLKAIRVDKGWKEIMEGATYTNGRTLNEVIENANKLEECFRKEKLDAFLKALPQIKGYKNLVWHKA